MAMFADILSNFDLHNINTNGLLLLSNHRCPLRSRDFEKSRRLNLLRITSETQLLLMIKHIYQIKVNILFYHRDMFICHYQICFILHLIIFLCLFYTLVAASSTMADIASNNLSQPAPIESDFASINFFNCFMMKLNTYIFLR